MDMVDSKKITLGIIAIVLLATMAYIYSAPQVTTPAESLIASAERLQQLVYCRNQVLQNLSQNSQLFTQIVNLTATGDNYLAKAKQYLNLGNATQAMQYAVLALRTYGQALDLQEKLRDTLGTSFASCRAVLAPQQANLTANLYRNRVRNETCKWSQDFYPQYVAINVSLQRVNELESIASRAASSGYDTSNATRLLNQARQLLLEAQSLASNCLLNESAHRLAEARKLIGQATSELARAGAMRTIAEMRRNGLDVNGTSVGEVMRALRARKFEEYLLNKTADTLLNVTRNVPGLERQRNRLQLLEQLLARIQERAKGIHKQLALQLRELVQEAINLAEKAPEMAKNNPGELARQAQDIGNRARQMRGGGRGP
jgi:hypothetical protein